MSKKIFIFRDLQKIEINKVFTQLALLFIISVFIFSCVQQNQTENIITRQSTLASPSISSPDGSIITNKSSIILVYSPSDAAAYYTIDQSEPTKESGILYNGKFKIPSDFVGDSIMVRAKSFKDGFISSKISEKIFTVKADTENTVDISSLTVSTGKLDTEFSTDIKNYCVNLPYSTESIKIKAETLTDGGTIKIDGVETGSGNYSSAIKLTAGAKKNIKIVVSFGTASKTYTITVTRQSETASTNNLLSKLSINNVNLAPDFSNEITSYTAEVLGSIDEIVVDAALEDTAGTLKINDEDPPATIPLKYGKNTITVKSISESNSEKIYTIVVNRIPDEVLDTNSYLKSITVSSGILSPVFSKDTLNYSFHVPYEKTSLTLTAAPESDDATVKINQKSSPLTSLLTEGGNTFSIVVTAQNGDTKEYSVVVTRDPEEFEYSDNADLKSLLVAGVTLKETFSPSNLSYTAATTAVTTVTISADAEDDGATVYINGTNCVKSDVALAEGENNIAVKVVAEDSVTIKNYQIKITVATSLLTANAGSDITAITGSTVKFDGSASSVTNGSIVSYTWDNGLTGVNPTKVYSTTGEYTVKLTVTDDKARSATDTVIVKIVDSIPYRDFREETVYFMMTDRFCDGNTSNNNIWGDEFLPSGTTAYDYSEDKCGVLSYYHGGDFEGIIKNLDYIKEMGFTAIWITPVVKQPEGRRYNTTGEYEASAFHGYWGHDFDQIDPHLHSSGKNSDGWGDFDKLVAAIHAKGMKLMLDIVVNHGQPGDSVKGSASKWAADWNKIIMDKKTWIYDKTTDPLVDSSNPKTGFFSYPGTGSSWLLDLLDFNGNGPAENSAMPHLKNVYKRFIDHGVDAFRIDTVVYMSHDNWADFTSEMYNYAKSKGNEHFYMVGEAWSGDRNGTNNAVGIIYGTKGANNFHMLDLHNSSMDYPGWLGNVFKGAAGFGDGNVSRIYGQYGDLSGIYDPTYLGTFVDNHDVFRANGILTETQYKNNLNYIYLFRGIPIVYYGTEALYSWSGAHATTNKDDVCARWMLGDNGINYVKNNKPAMYKHIKMLNSVRRNYEVLRKGAQTNLVMDGDKAVIKRVYDSSVAYISMSKGSGYSYTFTGLDDGTYKKIVPDSANATYTETSITVSGGSVTVEVSDNSFIVITK